MRWRVGSVTGLEHVRLGRNNQDAAAVFSAGGVTSLVVADGCSSSPRSEVGARLGAMFLARALVERKAMDAAAVNAACDAMLGWLAGVADALGPRTEVVGELLLFGFLAAVSDGERVVVCGAGDGLFHAGGRLHVLEPDEGNAPDYLAYRLVPCADLARPAAPDVRVHYVGALERVVLATDGALPIRDGLEALGAKAFEGASPHGLTRALTVLAQRERTLFDDTTLAVLER